MTHPKLEELVEHARRERPAAGALSAVARSLSVPFVAAPLAALVVPSSAAAAVLAKAGLSRVALFGWSAGSAVAISGMAAAVLLSQPASVPAEELAPPPAPRASTLPPPSAAPEPAPAKVPVVPNERRVVKDAPSVWDEPQLIERARIALSSDPRRALALAQEHQRRFPAGALGLEREVILIEALARSGQTSEAKRRASSFEAKYPKSIHLPRIRALRERLGS